MNQDSTLSSKDISNSPESAYYDKESVPLGLFAQIDYQESMRKTGSHIIREFMKAHAVVKNMKEASEWFRKVSNKKIQFSDVKEWERQLCALFKDIYPDNPQEPLLRLIRANVFKRSKKS